MQLCVKCKSPMILQDSGPTEEVWVCSNTACPNKITRFKAWYQGLKASAVILSVGAALVGIDHDWDEGDDIGMQA